MARDPASLSTSHRSDLQMPYLALFRLHAKSITGSRRHSQMMKADADRMFSLSRGRRWTALDTLRAYLFRIERILTHPGAVESAIRARMRRSY